VATARRTPVGDFPLVGILALIAPGFAAGGTAGCT